MAITTTTLSGAAGSNDTVIGVVSATGITAPVTTTGAGFTYLKVDNELMAVTSVAGTAISVLRGYAGTVAASHVASAPVLIGAPTDFANFRPATYATTPKLPDDYSPIGGPLTGAVIAPTGGYIHHFTGTVELTTITPPAGLVSGGNRADFRRLCGWPYVVRCGRSELDCGCRDGNGRTSRDVLLRPDDDVLGTPRRSRSYGSASRREELARAQVGIAVH